MISLPAELPEDSNTVENVFGNDLAAEANFYGTKWGLYSYNWITNEYIPLEYGSSLRQARRDTSQHCPEGQKYYLPVIGIVVLLSIHIM
jgi:hypothetical protein